LVLWRVTGPDEKDKLLRGEKTEIPAANWSPRVTHMRRTRRGGGALTHVRLLSSDYRKTGLASANPPTVELEDCRKTHMKSTSKPHFKQKVRSQSQTRKQQLADPYKE